MRASGGTKFGLSFFVVDFTNSTIAFLAGPSLQDGSGSVWAYARANSNRNKNRPQSFCLSVCAPFKIFPDFFSLSWRPSREGPCLDEA
jgi:prepilin signal peptidase PulO-like enzyme (type II secretory pathway)